MENPEIRVLLELRKELDEQLAELREKADQIESYIQALDSVIGVSSFATADTAIGAAATVDALSTDAEERAVLKPDEPRSIQVMNKPGDLELATIELEAQSLTVIPASHAIYDIKRGAFARFFVERILGQFQQGFAFIRAACGDNPNVPIGVAVRLFGAIADERDQPAVRTPGR